jgi:hypothetical protein
MTHSRVKPDGMFGSTGEDRLRQPFGSSPRGMLPRRTIPLGRQRFLMPSMMAVRR